jgi:hypothetical protein
MRIPFRQFCTLIVLAVVTSTVRGQIYYTGIAVTNLNNVPQPTFAQTYTLTGSPGLPQQIKVVSSYAGGNYQTEVFIFGSGGQVIDKLLDPTTGRVVSARSGTYVVSAITSNGTFSGVTIAVNVTESPRAADTFKIFYATNDGGPVNLNSTNLKATFSSTSGGVTTATVFNGDQIAPLPPAQPTTPRITTQPVATTVRRNKTAQFKVVATSNQPLSYARQKFKANLRNDSHISGVNTAMLTLSKVNVNFIGLYRVIVSNASGQTASREVMLTVK